MAATSQQGTIVEERDADQENVSLIDWEPIASPFVEADPYCHITDRHNRSGISEVTSMLDSLYLDPLGEEQHPPQDEEEDAEAVSMVEQIQELQLTVETLENRLKDTIDSTVNRVEGLRSAMETMVKETKKYVDIKLQRFDQAVVDCLK